MLQKIASTTNCDIWDNKTRRRASPLNSPRLTISTDLFCYKLFLAKLFVLSTLIYFLMSVLHLRLFCERICWDIKVFFDLNNISPVSVTKMTLSKLAVNKLAHDKSLVSCRALEADQRVLREIRAHWKICNTTHSHSQASSTRHPPYKAAQRSY